MRNASRVLVLAGVIALAGCVSAPTGRDESGVDGGVVEVQIARSEFTPRNVTVPVGAIVRWSNKDATGHTVTPDTVEAWGSGGSGNDLASWLQQNDTWTFTFVAHGTYDYHCIPHSAWNRTAQRWEGQVGRIIVAAPT